MDRTREVLLGALKAAVPSLLAILLVVQEALGGAELDQSRLRVLVIGAITSAVVYAVPNLIGGSKILEALKAVAPAGLAIVTVLVNALFGDPLDLANLQALVAGLVIGFVVFLVPNVVALDEPGVDEVDYA